MREQAPSHVDVDHRAEIKALARRFDALAETVKDLLLRVAELEDPE